MISSNLRLSQSFWWLFHLWQRRHFQASVIAAREATTNKWNINKITSTFGDQDEFDCFHLISGKQFGRGGAGVAEGGSIKYHWTSCLCQQGHLHPRPPLQPDKVADPWSSFQKNFHFTFLTGIHFFDDFDFSNVYHYLTFITSWLSPLSKGRVQKPR